MESLKNEKCGNDEHYRANYLIKEEQDNLFDKHKI